MDFDILIYPFTAWWRCYVNWETSVQRGTHIFWHTFWTFRSQDDDGSVCEKTTLCMDIFKICFYIYSLLQMSTLSLACERMYFYAYMSPVQCNNVIRLSINRPVYQSSLYSLIIGIFKRRLSRNFVKTTSSLCRLLIRSSRFCIHILCLLVLLIFFWHVLICFLRVHCRDMIC